MSQPHSQPPKEKVYKAGVTFFIWLTSFADGAPGHASMRMYYPRLSSELAERNMVECMKLVFQGQRATRDFNRNVWQIKTLGEHKVYETRNEPVPQGEADPHQDIVDAGNQLYLSFWPTGYMPQIYKEDMTREISANAHAPLSRGSEIVTKLRAAQADYDRCASAIERAREINDLGSVLKLQAEQMPYADAIAGYQKILLDKTMKVKDKDVRVFAPRDNQVFIPRVEQSMEDVMRNGAGVRARSGGFVRQDKYAQLNYTEKEEINGVVHETPASSRERVYRNLHYWGTEADGKKTVPCLYAGDLSDSSHDVFGLSLFRMAKWWNAFLNENMEEIDHGFQHQGVQVVERHSKYNMYSTQRNCAAACVGAMRAGGAEAYAPFSGKFGFVGTIPNDVEQWVAALETRMETLKGMVGPLRNIIAKVKQSLEGKGPVALAASGLSAPKYDSLMSLQTFKSKTAVLGKVRHGAISALDGHLTKFHTLTWDLDAHFPEQLRCMIGIVTEAHNYFQGSRQSPEDAKRGEGVALLVRQVFDVLTHPKRI